MARVATAVLVAAAFFGVQTVVHAQINGASPRDSKACDPDSGSHLKTPDTPTPKGSGATTGSSENLSDKLSRSDGVLCPPNVDPEIKQPTPNTGKMPVIPPPGSPGGDPSVQPK